MVLSAIDDRNVSRQICEGCREKRIPVNIADMPSECDFYFGAMVERGPLQVMVSTNGKSPRLAHKIREHLEKGIDELNVEKAIKNISILRDMVRAKTTGDGDKGYDKATIKTRMGWVSSVCDRLSFREMAALTEEDMEKMVASYPK
jgi:precorrin-2 dehydrogenase/sirohydrochlorin ferrochelatase